MLQKLLKIKRNFQMTGLERQGHYKRFSGDREKWVLGSNLDIHGKRLMTLGLLMVTYMNKKKGV